MITENQLFIDRYMSLIWNKKDFSVLHQVFDKNAIIYRALGDLSGLDAIEKDLKEWQTAFPDMCLLILEIFEQNDLIAVHWKAGGTHQGIFMGVEATLQPIKCNGIWIYRLKEGKIIECWDYINISQILQQINCQYYYNHEMAL
jgi:predicted ester cyclase